MENYYSNIDLNLQNITNIFENHEDIVIIFNHQLQIKYLNQTAKSNLKTTIINQQDNNLLYLLNEREFKEVLSITKKFVIGLNDEINTIIDTQNSKDDIKNYKVRLIKLHELNLILLSITDYSLFKQSEKLIETTNLKQVVLLNLMNMDSASEIDLLDYLNEMSIIITDSKIGYVYYYSEKTKLFTLFAWSKSVHKNCTITEPQTVYELEKTGIWGEVVRQNRPIIVNDFNAPNEFKKGYPEGHVTVNKFMSIPIRENGEIVAVIGVGNKETNYTDNDLKQLIILGESAWKIIHNRKLNQTIEEERARLNNIIKNASKWVWEIDDNFNFIFSNENCLEIIGLDNNEIIGKNFSDFTRNDNFNELKTIFKNRLINDYQLNSIELELINIKSENIIIEFDAIPIHNSNSKLIGYQGIASDITQRKRLEYDKDILISELKVSNFLLEEQTQKIQDLNLALTESENYLKELNINKDKFFSIISHDLRSPFNGFLGLTENLIKNFDLCSKDEIYKIIIELNDSSKNIFKLLNNLLKWSQIQRGKIKFDPQMLNLNYILKYSQDVLYQTAKNKQIEIITNFSKEDIWVECDYEMLDTVIRNFLSNAIKFSNLNSKIIIEVKDETDFVQISIRDFGIGMSEEIKSKLFKIDEKATQSGTSGEEGNGLGLILCNEFIEMNNGKLWFESSINEGTCFYFTLPKKQKQINCN